MMIEADVKSGQCKICLLGVTNAIPVLEMGRPSGMNAWMLTVCRTCAAEMRRHLDEFLSPRDE